MRQTEEMFTLAASEGIRIDYRTLKPFCNGLYIRSKSLSQPQIFLDPDLLINERLHRAVLAEELGHHFSTYGQWVTIASSGCTSYQQMRKKEEMRALRWARNYLCPEDDVLRLARSGLRRWEIADELLVPETWVVEQLKRIGRQCA